MTVAVVVPTYKRPHLLKLLIEDITTQETLPSQLTVIDGAPHEDHVMNMLQSLALPFAVCYVPSNHGNLPYQRYLGWLASNQHDQIIYLDDDLRLPDQRFLDEISQTFAQYPDVVGVTARTIFPEGTSEIEKLRSGSSILKLFVKLLGNNRHLKPGGITPTGHRLLPPNEHDHEAVDWLQGRVMAFRTSALEESDFRDDLFAMYELRQGKAEDTILSRFVMRKGPLMYTNTTYADHPNADAPQAFPNKARPGAFAIAYSRRYINDTFRVPEQPRFSDRMALLKGYLGNSATSWLRAIIKPTAVNFAYALGYTQGAVKGLLSSPSAQDLTPDIQWRADARQALANKIDLPAS